MTASKPDLPEPVREVLVRFLTAEFTTIGKDGTPVTWLVTVQHQEDEGTFLLCTSIGYPGKVFNIRRDNRVSLSYSEATGSGLTDPPLVVVQGYATVDEEIRTSMEGYEDFWVETIMGPQPNSKMISSNPVMRWYMDFYYMRHYITVKPTRFSWWPQADYTGSMQTVEVD
jgi:hypothetical protein